MASKNRIVIDTSAFIDAGLSVLNLDGSLFTIPAVLSEIKDGKTRRKLSFMPDLLHQRVPLPEYVNYVINFASKLGEARSLSDVDIHVMALACQYYEETGQKCKALPEQRKPPVLIKIDPNKVNKSRQKLPGFYYEPDTSSIHSNVLTSHLAECTDQDVLQCVDHLVQLVVVRVDSSKAWITPSNLSKFQKRKEENPADATIQYPVACVTTDFVMQNVLKQMGVPVIGVNGKSIKHVRRYCRFCIVCQRIVADDEEKCHTCGCTRLIQKIRVYAKPNGKSVYFQNKNFRIRGHSPPVTEQSMKCCKPKRKVERRPRKPVLDDLGLIGVVEAAGKSRRQR